VAVIPSVIVIPPVVAAMIIAPVTTVPVSVMPVRPAACQQESAGNSHEHHYCTHHF
jgi:hypothetical protein